MNKLKVGEYFQLPLKSIDYQNGIIDCNGFGVLFGDLDEKEKEALCIAVNSHDQLVDTIAEQEKVINELLDLLESFYPYSECDENGDEVLLGGDSRHCDGSESLGEEVMNVFAKYRYK